MSDQYQDMGEKPDIEAQRVVSSEPVVTVTAAELVQLMRDLNMMRAYIPVSAPGRVDTAYYRSMEFAQGKLNQL